MRVRDRLVELNGNEVATAIDAYLTAHNVNIKGPRTIQFAIGGGRFLLRDVEASVYVDPAGTLADNRGITE